MTRKRRDLSDEPQRDAEADAAEELLWLSRFMVASERGSRAEAIHRQVKQRAAELDKGTASERLDRLWVFIEALGAAESARHWVAYCARIKEGLAAGAGHD